MDQRQKILSKCNGIPIVSLVNYINSDIVSVNDLKKAGLTSEKISELHSAIKENESTMWRNACKTDTVQVYAEFLSFFPEGEHSNECKQRLLDKEAQWWEDIKLAPTEEAIGKYLEIFPDGRYVSDARLLLNDLPWLEACKIGTEAAFLSEFFTKLY